jgi:hypothetical protein
MRRFGSSRIKAISSASRCRRPVLKRSKTSRRGNDGISNYRPSTNKAFIEP